MYTKHHTKALVLTGYDTGEADRVYALLTPDLGKVYAKAHGVREHRAKHKPALQSLSEVYVSLVRGKNGWRITNVSAGRSLYNSLATNAAKLAILTRVLKLVRRLMAGEGNGEQIFSIITALSDALASRTLTERDLKALEVLAVTRMLSVLGYLRGTEQLGPFMQKITDMSPETLLAFVPHTSFAVKALNESLEATHL